MPRALARRVGAATVLATQSSSSKLQRAERTPKIISIESTPRAEITKSLSQPSLINHGKPVKPATSTTAIKNNQNHHLLAKAYKKVKIEYLGQARDSDELDRVLSRVSPSMPQVALAARSNAGKSSLVNALLGQKLAIVSKVPGRTRVAHAYQADGFVLIDLPGYGFAEGAKRGEAEKMSNVVADVALERQETSLVMLLMDARRMGPMDSDELMVNSLKKSKRAFEFVFTKVDSLNKTNTELLKKMYPMAWFTSSKRSLGISDLRKRLSVLRPKSG